MVKLFLFLNLTDNFPKNYHKLRRQNVIDPILIIPIMVYIINEINVPIYFALSNFKLLLILIYSLEFNCNLYKFYFIQIPL